MRVNIIILVIILLSVMYLSADGVEPQGIGTEEEPYLVDSLDNLLWISTNADSWESYFVQVADIDASATEEWNEGAGFSPIGWWVSPNEIQAFRGSYLGNCFVIEGLYINRPENDAGGMFGYTITAILDGIKLVDADICGDNYVGGLAGFIIGTLISNCSVEGDVSGDWSVGGLVGYNYSSEITDCYAAVNVAGGEYVGGLTGNNALDSEVTGCYTTGSVTGSELVGGLVGYNVRAVINNSYTTASVNGNFGVGGLVGENDQSTIANSYASGGVTGEVETGGLVGRNNSEISSSLWNLETSSQLEGIGNNEGGTVIDVLGKTTAEMQEMETYTDIGWDFEGETANGTEEIWDIGEGLNNDFAFLTALEWTIIENGLYAWFTADKLMLELEEEVHFYDLSSGEIVSWEWDFDNDGSINSEDQDPVWNYNEAGTYSVSLTITDAAGRESETLLREDYIAVIVGGEQPAGSGTEDDPFQIANLSNLLWLSIHENYWDCCYIQTDDIDATETQEWNEGAGFSPIGDYDNGLFIGSYNGDDHIIDGLYINRPDASSAGLFGYVNAGTIESLGLTNVNITGSWCVGSLAGEHNQPALIVNCYATGSIYGETELGGLVGHSVQNTIINSYYNYEEITINDQHQYTRGVLPAELYNAWINNDLSLDISEYLAYEGGFYMVNNATDLEKLLAFGQNSEVSFKLTVDIDLGDRPDFYIPYLTADFDGDHHIIENLNINALSNSVLGLFGCSEGAEITNLGVVNAEVSGIICIGGLAGLSISSEISDCYAIGNFSGSYYSGGLVGGCYQAAISNSYASGEVGAIYYAGGLTGDTYSSCTISNCYATCNVTAERVAGGLVGLNETGTINDCYATGSVTGEENAGGLVGVNSSSTIQNCIWNIETSGQTEGVGGDEGTINNLLGKTTAEMQEISTYTDIGWDFVGETANGDEDIWSIETGINEGFPFIYDIEYPVSNDEVPDITNKLAVYPNPFNPVVNIYFELAETDEVLVTIYNVKGQKVTTLRQESCEAGGHCISWKADKQASGIYLLRFESGDMSQVRKITLLK